MKRLLTILTVIAGLIVAWSCSKDYVETYDTLFRTDAEGNSVPRMFTWYDVTSSTGTLAIVVYYSGEWTVNFADEPDWAYLDKTGGKGVQYIHVGYLQNNSSNTRALLLKLNCDNGESLDITINQAGL